MNVFYVQLSTRPLNHTPTTQTEIVPHLLLQYDYMGPVAHSWLGTILESRQQDDIYYPFHPPKP